MKDEEKKSLEAQLALREKNLSLKERRIRYWLRTICITGVFLCCFVVIGIGGYGLCRPAVRSVERASKEGAEQVTKQFTKQTANAESEYEHEACRFVPEVHEVTVPAFQNTVKVELSEDILKLETRKPSSPEHPHSSQIWPFDVNVVLSGLLIFAALGTMAYTARLIFKSDND